MLVEIAIGGTVLLLSEGLVWVINKCIEVKQKNEEIEALRKAIDQYANTYSFEKPDIRLITKVRKYLDKKFDNNFEEEFAKYKTMDEKKRFALEVASKLAKCMDVTVNDVMFEDLGPFTNGYTKVENGNVCVVLNEALLVADLRQLVKTTCHELRHCVQIRSLAKNKWGFSSQRVAQWLYSWQNYVDASSAESFEAYRKQIIEVDANAFADAVMNY